MNKTIIYMDGKRRGIWKLETESEFEEALKHIEFHSKNGNPEIIGIVSCEQAEAWQSNAHDPAAEGELDAIENVPRLGGDMNCIRNGTMNIKPGTAWKVFHAKTMCEYFYYQATTGQHRKFGIDAAVAAFHLAEQHFWDMVNIGEVL
jgi:hypothetical protein